MGAVTSTGVAGITSPVTGCTGPAAGPDVVLSPAGAGTDYADAAACCEIVASPAGAGAECADAAACYTICTGTETGPAMLGGSAMSTTYCM